VLEHGVEIIQRQEHELTLWLINKLKSIPNVLLYTASTPKAQGPVVSFNIKGLNPSDVGYILQNSYGITVRTGLHCSPLIHKTLGTERHGTVRVSLSYFTTQQDLQTLVQAVKNISNSL
jgi:selenocysteine lyase/cysteine desulfurase